MAAAKISTLAIFLLGLSCFSCLASGDPNTTPVFSACSRATYQRGEPYMYALLVLLEDLSTITPSLVGYNFYTQSKYEGGMIYGHGGCNTALSHADCATCMTDAVKQVTDQCYESVGAQLVLQDCQIRYEEYRFLN